MRITPNSSLLSPTEKWVVFLMTTFHRLSSWKHSGILLYTILLCFISIVLYFIYNCISNVSSSFGRRRSETSFRLFTYSGAILLLAVLIHNNIIRIPFKYYNNHCMVVQKDDFYEAWITFQNFTIRDIPNNQPLYYSDGTWYRNEEKSSIVRWRGINLPAKTPSFPPELQSTAPSSSLNNSFEEYMNLLYASKTFVSFVDRPIPLSMADEHFARLSLYGFNLIRLSVPWEVCCIACR